MRVLKQARERSSSRAARRRHPALAALAAIAAATALAGCVVVPARPVYYRPMPVRPYAYVVF